LSAHEAFDLIMFFAEHYIHELNSHAKAMRVHWQMYSTLFQQR